MCLNCNGLYWFILDIAKIQWLEEEMKRVDAWLQQADSFLANEHITKMSLESLEPHYLRSQVSIFTLYYLFLNVVIKIKF